MKTFLRGSEWRLWDLQIHTPFSFLANGFGDDWDNYVKQVFQKAIANNVSAIGITDYFTIDGYKKIKEDYLNKPAKLKQLFSEEEIEKIGRILLLPNIEFRLNKLVGANRINFHVLFSNEVDIKDIEENFLHELDFVYEAAPQTADQKLKLKVRNLEKLGEKLIKEHEKFKGQAAIRIGMMNAVVDDKQICDILSNKKYLFENKYLLAIPSDEDLSAISWNGQDHLTRKLLIQKSDLLIATNPNTIQWALGKKHSTQRDFINEFKSLKPCIGGSDAHKFEELFVKNENKKVWIKADLTFEGLKQIKYEPEERVRIQETNPAYDFEKFVFTEIEVSNPVKVFQSELLHFEKSHIPLNSNLVTIIGGRGTGKSVLVNYKANGFKQYSDSTHTSVFNLSDDIKVRWKKSHTGAEETFQLGKQHDLPFLFIQQSEVKEKVKNPRILGDEIKKILELEDLSFNLKIDERIQQYKRDFNTIKEWFDKRDENSNPINSLIFIDGEIERNKNLLERITTEGNKEKLEKYSHNIGKLQANANDKSRLGELKEFLVEVRSGGNTQIHALNKNIPELDFRPQFEAIDKAGAEIDGAIRTAQEENEKIKEDFKDFKGDLTSLLSNVEKFKITISNFERRKGEIEEKEKQKAIAAENKKTISELVNSEFSKQKKIIDSSWNRLLQGKEGWTEEQRQLMQKIINNRGIKIEGEIVFNKSIFLNLIREFVDGRAFRAKGDDVQLEELLGINDYSSFIQFLSDFESKKAILLPYLRNSGEDFEKLFYDLHIRARYSYVQPKITFGGKELHKISVGQRGTIYLCLKLATNTFSQTIIFDQPEDDLDNDFIFKDLISLFKEIKKYRQLIIVTHNANLVVNADAEQVIIASNDDEKLSYSSGSLENPQINNLVCDILEGGRIAFEQRRNKYGLQLS